MKARDLEPSYNFRRVLQNPGPPISRRRVIIATSDSKSNRKTSYLQTEHASNSNGKLETHLTDDCFRNLDDEIRHWHKERKDFKGWFEQRKVLRKGLESIKFDGSWIVNKPDKTESELRVMQRLSSVKKEGFDDEQMSYLKKRGTQKLLSAHVDSLPLIEIPLPMALALIADYLHKNRLRLIDLFATVDSDKDWLMTREELKKSFKRIAIPLTDHQLDELITTLDINNDNQLSYKELSLGIEAYYKDRRWQKMKEKYDKIVVEKEQVISGSGVHTLGINVKPRLDLLNLPEWNFTKENANSIYLKKVALDTHASKLKEKYQRVKRGKSLTDNGKKPLVEATLLSSTAESKLKYFRHVNEECKRSIDALHAKGIYAPSGGIRHVLVPPADNAADKCLAYLSSSLSAYPFNHAVNVAYRRAQKRMLKKLKSSSNISGKEKHAIDAEKNKRKFLPRVASSDAFEDIAIEGRRRRRRIETASPSPCWPQHLLDKLCLCMDDCHLRKDGKDVLFNLVTGK